MIFNIDKRIYLARSPRTMISFGDRLRGMIGRSFSPAMDSAVFPNCSSIHTFFMREPIDVVFLDNESRIVRIETALRPWRPAVVCRGAVTVIELPANTDGVGKSRIGDTVNLNMNLTPEAAENIILCHNERI